VNLQNRRTAGSSYSHYHCCVISLRSCVVRQQVMHKQYFQMKHLVADSPVFAILQFSQQLDFSSATKSVLPGIFGDLYSPVILTKTVTRCFSAHEIHSWRHVGTYIQMHIFTSTDANVWHQDVNQSSNDVTDRMLDAYFYVSIDLCVHVHIYNSIFQYVNMFERCLLIT